MEAWKAILIALGGNAMLIAVLAWLAKSLFSEWLKKTTVERQIVFSKLHEKRTEAISNIYIELNEYVSTCKSFLMSAMHVEEDERQELLSSLNYSNKKFRDVFQKNKLYLKRSLCEQIELAFKDTQMPSYNYIFALGAFVSSNIGEEQHNQEWEKAFLAFSEHVPKLLENLENEFRTLLRSEEYS